MHIGERIKTLRLKKGWSQKELSSRVGLNSSVMNRIERSERKVYDDEILSIASVLDSSTDYLLGRTDDPNEDLDFYQSDFAKDYGFTPPSDDDERVFFQDFHKMTKEEKEEAIRYIKIQREMRKNKKEDE